MLDGLGGGDQRSVEYRLVGDIAGDVIGFLDDALDRGAGRALGFLADRREHAL